MFKKFEFPIPKNVSDWVFAMDMVHQDDNYDIEFVYNEWTPER